MNFSQATMVENNSALTTTENGMVTNVTTSSKNLDLFSSIGAARAKSDGELSHMFLAAYTEDPKLFVRIMLWARDIRGGAGERKVFRSFLNFIEVREPEMTEKIIKLVPVIGRWDDLLVFKTKRAIDIATEFIRDALLVEKNGLAGKWLPRKGEVAVALRQRLGFSPKFYRKTLVGLTNVVETQMCSNKWDEINYSHVPSVASKNYRKSFLKHSPEKYGEYATALKSGDPTVKVNASAIFPHDVLTDLYNFPYKGTPDQDVGIAQWNSLPDYMGDQNVLPMSDVSDSMNVPASNGTATCMDVSVALGLYISERNKGPFKDLILTFSSNPQLLKVEGNIIDRAFQLKESEWETSTNFEAAIEKILEVGVKNHVAPEDMPQYLLVLSDMQFDEASGNIGVTALDMVSAKYKKAGYVVPKIVFWNLRDSNGVAAKSDSPNVALVSGFSPAILKSILSNPESYTPFNVMLDAVMNDRYAI